MAEKVQNIDRPISIKNNKINNNTRQRWLSFTKQKGHENIIFYWPVLSNVLTKVEGVSWSNTVMPLPRHLLGSSLLSVFLGQMNSALVL